MMYSEKDIKSIRSSYDAPSVEVLRGLFPMVLQASFSADVGLVDWEYDESDPNTEL